MQTVIVFVVSSCCISNCTIGTNWWHRSDCRELIEVSGGQSVVDVANSGSAVVLLRNLLTKCENYTWKRCLSLAAKENSSCCKWIFHKQQLCESRCHIACCWCGHQTNTSTDITHAEVKECTRNTAVNNHKLQIHDILCDKLIVCYEHLYASFLVQIRVNILIWKMPLTCLCKTMKVAKWNIRAEVF